jgi:ribosomal protein L31
MEMEIFMKMKISRAIWKLHNFCNESNYILSNLINKNKIKVDWEDCGSRLSLAIKAHEIPSQQKRLDVVACSCHPSYTGKYKIEGLHCRPA